MSYFGRNIKKIRNAKNISQTAFAELFNLTRASIGAYEEGRAEAKIDTIISIANYFKISIDKLLVKELTLNDIFHLNQRTKSISGGASHDTNLGDDFVNLYSENTTTIEQQLSVIENKIDNIEEILKKHIPN